MFNEGNEFSSVHGKISRENVYKLRSMFRKRSERKRTSERMGKSIKVGMISLWQPQNYDSRLQWNVFLFMSQFMTNKLSLYFLVIPMSEVRIHSRRKAPAVQGSSNGCLSIQLYVSKRNSFLSSIRGVLKVIFLAYSSTRRKKSWNICSSIAWPRIFRCDGWKIHTQKFSDV